MLHLPIALCVVNRGPALLDTKGKAQFFNQGGCEVHPPVTQQLSGHSEDHYEALVEHLCNHFGHLVLCHYSKGIPHEIVGHHKDIFNHRGFIHLHCGLNTGVVKMHKLQWCICLNQTEGNPWHLSLKCLAVRSSPHYSSAILSHHGPPEPLLNEGQGPLLSLVASILMHHIKRHAALSHGDDECQHSLSLAFWCRVDVHQTLIQDETVVDVEEHLALLCLGFCSQALLEESIPSGSWYPCSEVKPLVACS